MVSIISVNIFEISNKVKWCYLNLFSENTYIFSNFVINTSGTKLALVKPMPQPYDAEANDYKDFELS